MSNRHVANYFSKTNYKCACGTERPEAESTEEAVRMCPECSKNPKRERTELLAAFRSHERLREEVVESMVNGDYRDLGNEDS